MHLVLGLANCSNELSQCPAKCCASQDAIAKRYGWADLWNGKFPNQTREEVPGKKCTAEVYKHTWFE